MCTLTQPGIFTTGLPILTVTGTVGGIACGGSTIHIFTSGTSIFLTFANCIFLTYTLPIPTLPTLILLMLGIFKESILILSISGIMIPYYHMNLLQLNLNDPLTIEHN